MSLLRLQNLRFRRGSFQGTVPFLEIPAGTITGVFGASGSGKSSLLEAIGGFLPLEAGEIWAADRRIDGLPPEKRQTATVFQRSALFPHLNIEQNIAFGLALRGEPAAARLEQARLWLRKVGLEGLGERAASQISEGQAQRVALARALVVGFPVLLLDEPFSALDTHTRHGLRELVKNLVEEHQVAALLVSHDPEDVYAMATQVIEQDKGLVRWAGPVGEWKPLV
ncbi:ATP-binding cassette domain-containing protein [bacterium]|nr:ATP-binding cassette domain-containing protein [bacterium]